MLLAVLYQSVLSGSNIYKWFKDQTSNSSSKNSHHPPQPKSSTSCYSKSLSIQAWQFLTRASHVRKHIFEKLIGTGNPSTFLNASDIEKCLPWRCFDQVPSTICHCCNAWSGHITQTNSGIVLLGRPYRRRAGFVKVRREWRALPGSSAPNKHEQNSHIKGRTQLTWRRSSGHPALPSENERNLTKEPYRIFRRPRNHDDDDCMWKWVMGKVRFTGDNVQKINVVLWLGLAAAFEKDEVSKTSPAGRRPQECCLMSSQ